MELGNKMPERRAIAGGARRDVLLVPGIGNSGPQHWQSRWEANDDTCIRVQQKDWDNPVCGDWVGALESAALRAGPEPLIAAHSLGCLTVAHWLAHTSVSIAGALLVAVPDPQGATFPAQAVGFAPLPRQQFPCVSILVASTDDPYSPLSFARQCAEAWGSRFIDIGRAGHINADSGLGEWHEGRRLLRSLATEQA